MLSGPLPDSVNFVEYIESGASLRGFVPLSRFVRLCDLIESKEGDVEIELCFVQTNMGSVTAVGTATASVELVCQYCLELTSSRLLIDVNVRLVETDTELYALAPSVDGIVVDIPRLSLTELIEDDLILGLPMVPRHQTPCTEIIKGKGKDSRRPFADLSKLFYVKEGD